MSVEKFLVALNQLLLGVLNDPDQKDDLVVKFIRSKEYKDAIREK